MFWCFVTLNLTVTSDEEQACMSTCGTNYLGFSHENFHTYINIVILHASNVCVLFCLLLFHASQDCWLICVIKEEMETPQEAQSKDEVEEVRTSSSSPRKIKTLLIFLTVGRKLMINPNTHATVIGLIWAAIRFR